MNVRHYTHIRPCTAIQRFPSTFPLRQNKCSELRLRIFSLISLLGGMVQICEGGGGGGRHITLYGSCCSSCFYCVHALCPAIEAGGYHLIYILCAVFFPASANIKIEFKHIDYKVNEQYSACTIASDLSLLTTRHSGNKNMKRREGLTA